MFSWASNILKMGSDAVEQGRVRGDKKAERFLIRFGLRFRWLWR